MVTEHGLPAPKNSRYHPAWITVTGFLPSFRLDQTLGHTTHLHAQHWPIPLLTVLFLNPSIDCPGLEVHAFVCTTYQFFLLKIHNCPCTLLTLRALFANPLSLSPPRKY